MFHNFCIRVGSYQRLWKLAFCCIIGGGGPGNRGMGRMGDSPVGMLLSANAFRAWPTAADIPATLTEYPSHIGALGGRASTKRSIIVW